MKETSREEILAKIKEALENNPFHKISESIDDRKEIFFPFEDSLEINFARELHKVDGKFVFCIDEAEVIENLQQIVDEEKWESVYCNNPELQNLLLNAEIPFTSGGDDFLQMQCALTSCEFLIARFGSVMVSSAQTAGRQLNVFPPVHIILAYTSQLVPEISDALKKIKAKYPKNLPSMISLITGPSRTADIEKTLILGAHGPKDLYVFLVDDTD